MTRDPASQPFADAVPARLYCALAIMLLGACSDDGAAPPLRPPAPTVQVSEVDPNPDNVLSAIVRVRAQHADSVLVQVRAAGAAELEAVTPARRLAGDSARIPVLGLFADRHYTFVPVAFGAGGSVFGEPLEFVTDTLPADLPRYAASGSDPAPGYVVFAANPYGLVIDNSGRVVWYHRFPNGLGLNFMAQPNGRFVARPPTANPNDIEPWVEIDILGNTTRTLTCANQLQPRLHDLIALRGGDYWILCDETRSLDLSALGVPEARVIGTVVQHVSADGALLFDWSVFEHFTISAADIADRNGSTINWTHGNAIDLDGEGNPIVSFRNLGEITKIDAETGAIVWRLGGQHNQFNFIGTPTPAFSRQHGVRLYATDRLLLLDNLGDHTESRAERYALDTRAMTAQLVDFHTSAPAVVTQIGGSVQDVGNRVLVSFGTAGRVEEYDGSNRVVWQINGNAGYVFRAQRVRSLYTPGVGSSR